MTVDDPHERFASDNPFVGLRAFGVGDAELFFGREAQTSKLVARLRETRFLATVGASGCGKSSLVLAGLIPALSGAGSERPGNSWRIAVMRPGAAPIAALASVLARTQVLGKRADDPDAPRAAMLERLWRDELGLVDLVHAARLRKGESLLVVVDQFEELFRFAPDTDPAGHVSEAAAFVKLLLTAAAQKDLPIFVAMTLRSDFIGDCAKFRDLPEAVNDGVFLVPRLTRDGMVRAIEQPVLRGGEQVAPRLVARLLDDIGSGADQLPILEHALMRTWDAWDKDHVDGEPLDVRHYESIGEMRGAISKHANDIYAGLDARLKQIAERLFRCLTARDAENRGVRRPMTFGAVCAVTAAQPGDIERLVRIYAAPGVSFLSASGPLSNPKTVLDISHESVMRLWDQLRAWVDDEAESGKTYRRLVDDATAKRARWIDPELAIGEAWLAKNRASINPAWAARYDDGLSDAPADEATAARAHERFDTALAFLNASAAAPRRSAGTIIALVGVFFIAAVALAIFGVTKYNATVAERHRVEALNSATLALENAKAAQTRNLEAEIAKANRSRHLSDIEIERAKIRTEAANKRVLDAARLVKAARSSPSASPTATATATPAPSASPQPASPQPIARPSQSPRATSAPVRRPAAAAAAAGRDGIGANTACRRALDHQRHAADAAISRRDSYDAAVAGLAENAGCGNRLARIVNEGYLRSTLAAAEHELGLGDWMTDFKRADQLLAQCETLPGLQGTSAPADCLAQRRFNEQALAEFLPSSPRPAPR